MNALRHGLAAATLGVGDGPAVADSSMEAIYQRLRQIEVERVKLLNDIHTLSASHDLNKLNRAVSRLAALERYSQRSHSRMKKYMF
jgi:hypothetical protein